MKEYALSIAGTLLAFICYVSCESEYLPPATPSSGPYPPSGWKPDGRQLTLPNSPPYQGAEPPSPDRHSTDVPEFSVSEPELTTTIPEELDHNPAAKSRVNAAPSKPSPSPSRKQQEARPQPSKQQQQQRPQQQQQQQPQALQNEPNDKENTYEKGQYYILLPDGRLQRITYTTMPLGSQVEKVRAESENEDDVDDVENVDANTVEKKPKGYVANVKYQDVEPIKGPIYTYSNAPLVRVY